MFRLDKRVLVHVYDYYDMLYKRRRFLFKDLYLLLELFTRRMIQLKLVNLLAATSET